MKKHYSLPSFLTLSCAFTMVSFQCPAENLNPSIQKHTDINHTDIQSIDQQIESLEKQLAQLRRNMLNSEIHAQTYMIDNWHEFAEEINRSEDNEKVILMVKKQIQELKDQKKLLIKDKNPSSK